MDNVAIISNTASSYEPGRPEELSYLETQQQDIFLNFVKIIYYNPFYIILYCHTEHLQGFDHFTVHSARFANGHRRKRRLGVQIRSGQYNSFCKTGLVNFPNFQDAESGAEQCECEHHQPKSSVCIIFIRCEKCDC